MVCVVAHQWQVHDEKTKTKNRDDVFLDLDRSTFQMKVTVGFGE
jgi:hypothetical protein